jgi:hypothetical protein
MLDVGCSSPLVRLWEFDPAWKLPMLAAMNWFPATSATTGRNFVIAVALLLTFIALALRFYRLTNQSLWTDEVASIQTAQEPLSQMTRDSGSENVYLPGYFLLLGSVLPHADQNVEFRARALSAVAGGLSVPLLIAVVYCWRRQWGTALLAGLLLALNPLHLWYSQEVRAYAAMLFLGLLTLLAYELARTSRKPWWWAVYSISALGAIALHKTAIIFPVTCALWHVWEVWRQKGRWRKLGAHVVTLGIACGALFLRAYTPPPVNGRSRSILELGYTFMTFVGGYSFGPSITDIQSYGALGAVSRHVGQVGILVGVLALVALAYALQLRALFRGKETSLLVLNLGFVSLTTLAFAFPYNVRYTLPGLLAFLALVAVLSNGAVPFTPALSPSEGERENRRHSSGFPLSPSDGERDGVRGLSVEKRFMGRERFIALLAFGAVFIVGLWADAQWFYSPAYRKADSRAVAQWLISNQASVKSWTVLPEYLGYSVAWYLRDNPDIIAHRQPPTQAQTTSFPPVPDVLIIGRRHHITEPDKIIAAYRASAGPVRAISTIAGFELYLRESAGTQAR